MNTVRNSRSVGDGLVSMFRDLGRGKRLNRGAAWGLMIVTALLAFEIFNYSTTQFALADVLGNLKFAGFRWATILAFAFCGIDFAGIARIFTPQQGRDEPAEVWYLFGAWLLAAGFNATLTWWGVSVAIVNHTSAAAGAVISNATLIKVVPIFVAVMVWLIRVLIIGTFSLAGDNLFSTAELRGYPAQKPYPQPSRPVTVNSVGPTLRPASSLPRPVQNYRPAPKPAPATNFDRAEPTYHNLSFEAQSPYEAVEARKQ
ncbi:MAG TPA: hypothetical protein VLZ89_06580 [Anaerolineales bacterium]|nr:hypothetical protein [Anaerolineales bacterium]